MTFLCEQHGLRQRALVPIFATPSILSEMPARRRALQTNHINVLRRYQFSLPEAIARGEFRPLRDPAEADEEDLLVTSPGADGL